MNVNPVSRSGNAVLQYTMMAQTTRQSGQVATQPPATQEDLQPAVVVDLTAQAAQATQTTDAPVEEEGTTQPESYSWLYEQLEASRSEVEAAEEMWDAKLKCLKISGSIISGNNVPGSDYRYLMEHDPELYALSISSRVQKDDPEDKDSVLSDDDKKNPMEQAFESEIEAMATPRSLEVATPVSSSEASVSADLQA